MIIDQGRSREIAIGLCPQSLPVNNLPGWTPQTVGYHADNGGYVQCESGYEVMHL